MNRDSSGVAPADDPTAAAADASAAPELTATHPAVPPEAAGEAVRAFGFDDWTAQVITDYARAYSGGL